MDSSAPPSLAYSLAHILPRPACLPPQDDWDLDEEGVVQLDLKDQPEVQEKLRRRIDSVTVKVGGGGRERLEIGLPMYA